MEKSDKKFEIKIIGNAETANIPKESLEVFVIAIAEKIKELIHEESEKGG